MDLRCQKLRNQFYQKTSWLKGKLLYDCLQKDGTPEFTLRPTSFSPSIFIKMTACAFAITRQVREELVYPWGNFPQPGTSGSFILFTKTRIITT